MQISNHNLSAVIANNRLKKQENIVAQSMERLSSGISINHSKDQPAHMALSNKLNMHVDGMEQAKKNADNISSMLQTADTVMQNITNMIQRLRELSVQAANDTNTDEDKDKIQKEVEELKDEIDRMSRDTEFNRKGIFDGSLSRRIFSSKDWGTTVPHTSLERIYVSDEVVAGEYSLTLTAGKKTTTRTDSDLIDATKAKEKVTKEQAGTVSINGHIINIAEGDTYKTAFQKLQDGAKKGDASVEIEQDEQTSKNKLTFKSIEYGVKGPLNIETDNPALGSLLGLPGAAEKGRDATASGLKFEGEDMMECSYNVDGNHVIAQRPNGFQIDFQINENLGENKEVTLTVTDMGGFQAQFGENEDVTERIWIPTVNTETLYIDDVDVSTKTGASKALDRFDNALKFISKIRSTIGAYDNRMEAVSESLSAKKENLTTSVSKLRDTDMAAEMTEYTSANILVQASSSVLSQCNDQPEMVLQLLQ